MKKLVIVALGLAAIGGIANAQIHQRERVQQNRIEQGERSGQLSPREARRLQMLQARIHRAEARMRWRNGGRLNPAQRARLQNRLDRTNANIYRKKHNWQVRR